MVDYERVAQIYQSALARWQPPTKAVADVLGIPYTTAISRVRQARLKGFIEPADKRCWMVDKRRYVDGRG